MAASKDLVRAIRIVGSNYLLRHGEAPSGVPKEDLNRSIAHHLKNFSTDNLLPDELQELQLLVDLKSLISSPNTASEIDLTLGQLIDDHYLSLQVELPAKPTTPDLLNALISRLMQQTDQTIFENLLKSPRVRDFEEFSDRQVLGDKEGSGRFSHPTQRVRKPSDPDSLIKPKEWYAKYCESKEIALREVIAQEFFRLLIPEQPKTFIAKDAKGRYYVMSEGVPADTLSLEKIPFDTAHAALNENYGKENGYKGLGSILVTNLLLNEIDAKPGNILVLPKGQIIKIDGDFCFVELNNTRWKEDINHDISASDFAALPFIPEYSSFNWLDIYREGTLNKNYEKTDKPHTLINVSLRDNPLFRAEVNATTLKALLLPNELLKDFFKAYTHSQTEKSILQHELMHRIGQLRQASLENPEFMSYIKSTEAQEVVNQFKQSLTSFKTRKEASLLTPENTGYQFHVIDSKFSLLRRGISKIDESQDEKTKTVNMDKHNIRKMFPPVKPAPEVEATPVPAPVEVPKKDKVVAKKKAELPPIKNAPRTLQSIIKRALEEDDSPSTFSSNDRFFQSPDKLKLPELNIDRKFKKTFKP